jgi:release factor glutamine methyltransferase
MNIRQATNSAVRRLKEKNIPDPEFEAGILLSAILRREIAHLYANQEEAIPCWQSWRYHKAIRERLAGYSAAVIIGHKWFFGSDFIVDKNVLIPRPETELMVEETLARIKNNELRIKNIIDVGTGSGCVIISVAKNTLLKEIRFYGLDISRPALRVAKKNAIKNGVSGRIKFVYSDLLNTIDKSIFEQPILITANLPYLTPEQVKNSPTIQKEPKIALLAGNDGLDCYRLLFQQILDKVGANHRPDFIIMCEIDESQRSGMEKIARQYFPAGKINFGKDLGGADRLAIIEL